LGLRICQRLTALEA